MTTSTKKCGTCGNVKTIAEFSRDKAKKDGLNSQCKECKREYNKHASIPSSFRYAIKALSSNFSSDKCIEHIDEKILCKHPTLKKIYDKALDMQRHYVHHETPVVNEDKFNKLQLEYEQVKNFIFDIERIMCDMAEWLDMNGLKYPANQWDEITKISPSLYYLWTEILKLKTEIKQLSTMKKQDTRYREECIDEREMRWEDERNASWNPDGVAAYIDKKFKFKLNKYGLSNEILVHIHPRLDSGVFIKEFSNNNLMMLNYNYCGNMSADMGYPYFHYRDDRFSELADLYGETVVTDSWSDKHNWFASSTEELDLINKHKVNNEMQIDLVSMRELCTDHKYIGIFAKNGAVFDLDDEEIDANGDEEWANIYTMFITDRYMFHGSVTNIPLETMCIACKLKDDNMTPEASTIIISNNDNITQDEIDFLLTPIK